MNETKRGGLEGPGRAKIIITVIKIETIPEEIGNHDTVVVVVISGVKVQRSKK